jgi:hypothetical protein
MGWSLSKVKRIESGSAGISVNDLKALLSLYKITDSVRTEQLTMLARASRKPPWWSAYRDVAPSTLIHLIEYESAASAILQFENMVVPGILQTEDYARVVLQYYYTDKLSSERVGKLADLRIRREELLDLKNSPRFTFILDEAVLYRVVGGKSVMVPQIQRLVEAVKKPNITIGIVPFKAGMHPGMAGPFEIVEFADAVAENVVFLESPRADIISAQPEETLRCREAFAQIRKLTLTERDSLARLEEISAEMKRR